MLNKNTGQALLESVMALPFLVTLVSSILLGFYRFSSHYWLDYSAYRATLCLATEESVSQCKQRLIKRISLVPLSELQIEQFERHTYAAIVKFETKKLWGDTQACDARLSLPLRSDHFEEAL